MLDISEKRVSKPRYLKKETLAKNILQGVWKLEDLRELDWAIRMTYQANSKTFEKAKEEHTERLARIADAQGRTDDASAARGVKDKDGDPDNSPKKEKEKSRQTEKDDIVTDQTRGKGKK